MCVCVFVCVCVHVCVYVCVCVCLNICVSVYGVCMYVITVSDRLLYVSYVSD